MTARSLLACLALLVPVTGTLAQEPKEVGFRDDFAVDSRPQYRTGGEITWEKGRLQLGAGAWVSRAVNAECRIEVRAVLSLPEGKEDVRLVLRLRSGLVSGVQATVGRWSGQTWLGHQVRGPAQEVPGPAARPSAAPARTTPNSSDNGGHFWTCSSAWR
jgi:hypothetical protein